MAIAFRAKGTWAAGAGAVSPGLPSGIQNNDILLLFVNTANQPISTPTGWTQIGTNQTIGTGGAAGGSSLQVYYRRVVGGESAPSVSAANYITAIICAYSGVLNSGTPHEAVTQGNTTPAGTSITMSGGTTAGANRQVINAAGRDIDANSSNGTTAQSNTNLTSLAIRHTQTVNTGTGGGLHIGDGVKASAGAIGNTVITQTSSIANWMQFALIPQSD